MLSRLERDLSAEGYDAHLVSVTVEAVRSRLQPNMLIDAETTEMNRQRAREEVEDVVCVTGEVIVRQGAIVTPAQYAMLEALGKVDNDPTNMILGCALMMLALMVAVGLYMYRYELDIARRPRTLLLLGILYVLVVGLALFFRIFNPYFVPTATGLGLLLITLLVRPRLAIFSTILLSVPVALIAGVSDNSLFNAVTFTVLLTAFVSGPVAVTVLRHRQQRTAALLAGVLVGVTNFLCVIAVGMINGAVSSDTALNGLCAAGSGLCAAILCIGVQPILEWIFNLTTSAKLLELSNPNQPLLRRMLLEAPGSYHHSIIVANLAETAASAIGANGLLARVGAYYHDVGKLKRPMYFKENQMAGDNPHDRTDPRVSAAILTAHTRDGYQMGLKARLPEPILDIIRQHHGDSPMVFFYDKAVKLYGDKVDIAAFRYEGPRPRSREAGGGDARRHHRGGGARPARSRPGKNRRAHPQAGTRQDDRRTVGRKRTHVRRPRPHLPRLPVGAQRRVPRAHRISGHRHPPAHGERSRARAGGRSRGPGSGNGGYRKCPLSCNGRWMSALRGWKRFWSACAKPVSRSKALRTPV